MASALRSICLALGLAAGAFLPGSAGMAASEPGNPISTLAVTQATAGACSDQQDAGVSDAAELDACVKKAPELLASTGFQVVVWVLITLVLLGIGALLYWRRRKRTPDGGPADGGPPTGGPGTVRGADADRSSDGDDDDIAETVRYWV